MASNHFPGAANRRGSKKTSGNNAPRMNINNSMNMGMSMMPQAAGMPMNIAQNMGGAFLQGVMGAMGGGMQIPIANLQQQAGHAAQSALNNNQQMQGLMAMNNPNLANINMNSMGLNQLNQPQGQNNQLQLMNLLAQQRRQHGTGNNNQQQQNMQAPQTQMQFQPLMPNQAMQTTQSLIPNQALLQHQKQQQQQQQQQQLLLMNRQKEMQQGHPHQQSQVGGQTHPSSPTRWNANTNVQAMGVKQQLPGSSPVHHLQMAAAQAQAQNLFQDQLHQWKSQQGGNIMQSSRPPSTMQQHELGQQHRPGSSVSMVQQQCTGSSVSMMQQQHGAGPNGSMGQQQQHIQRRPSSKLSTAGMQSSMQQGNKSQLFPNTMQAPLMPNSLFSQSQAPSTSARRNQNTQKQAGQGNQSRPPSATSSRSYQSRSSSNATTDMSNQRGSQSQTHSLMQMPNQFFPQQSQQTMQSMQSQSRAPSNLPAAMVQNPLGQIQQRQASNNSKQPSIGEPSMLQQMGNAQFQIPGTQQPESRASFSRRGSNADNKSLGSVDQKSQRSHPQNQEIQKQSQNNAPSEAEPRQHQDQQVQAQTWFLIQQSGAEEGGDNNAPSRPESTAKQNTPNEGSMNSAHPLAENDASRNIQGKVKQQKAQTGDNQKRRASSKGSKSGQKSASKLKQEPQQRPPQSNGDSVTQQSLPNQINFQQTPREMQLKWKDMQAELSLAGQTNILQGVNMQYHPQHQQNQNAQLAQLQEMQRQANFVYPHQIQPDHQQPNQNRYPEQHQRRPSQHQQHQLIALQQQAHQRSLSLHYSLECQKEDTVLSNDPNQLRYSQPSLSDQQQRRPMPQSAQTMSAYALLLPPQLPTQNDIIMSDRANNQSSSNSGAPSINSAGIQNNFYNPKSKRRTSEKEDDSKQDQSEQLISGSFGAVTSPPDPKSTNPRSSFQLSSNVASPLTARIFKDQTCAETSQSKVDSHKAKKAKEPLQNTPQPVLTTEEILSIAIELPVEERIVFSSKQLLGAGKNGFSRITTSMQRMKRQRAKQIGEEVDEEVLKKTIFNGRFAKKIHTDLQHGLQYTNMMTEVLKSIIQEIDPENPLLSIPMPTVFDPEEPQRPARESTSTANNKQSAGQVSGNTIPTNDNGSETVDGGNPSGSTLRKRKSHTVDPELLDSINDSDGKHLTKREVGYRLFESTRWRSLETGVPVAAKVSSQEWILGRVVREWKSPGLTFTQMKELSEIEKDALFSEKVYIQDQNEDDINNTRASKRKHVLPLPVNMSEGNKWGARARKGSRVYALYPNTTSLYPGTVINSTMYSRGLDDIIVIEFDHDEDDSGSTHQRHIPARLVTLMPKESPAYKRKRKPAPTGGGTKKRKSQVLGPPSAASMSPPQASEDTSVDRMLLEMLAGNK